jgi:phenylacetate-coenzyme A ligase PaaK-like adenylate-forming protein
MNGWDVKVFGLTDADFGAAAIELFRYQYDNNPVYRQYADSIGKNKWKVGRIEEIPFLPVRIFKSHEVKTTDFQPQTIFESSGTTGAMNSRHYIKDLALYKKSFLAAFTAFYGRAAEWCIIGLLPSYLEKGNSSLVYMVDKLIKESKHPQGGFYLQEPERLNATITQLEQQGQKTLLIGVTYALLDFAEKFPQQLSSTIILETGGMKGRRKEMIREEVHQQLQTAFGIPAIHSEYGMTELLSQAYSKGNGLFECSPWMKVLVRDEEEPGAVKKEGRGIINVIDLANIYSCGFLRKNG